MFYELGVDWRAKQIVVALTEIQPDEESSTGVLRLCLHSPFSHTSRIDTNFNHTGKSKIQHVQLPTPQYHNNKHIPLTFPPNTTWCRQRIRGVLHYELFAPFITTPHITHTFPKAPSTQRPISQAHIISSFHLSKLLPSPSFFPSLSSLQAGIFHTYSPLSFSGILPR